MLLSELEEWAETRVVRGSTGVEVTAIAVTNSLLLDRESCRSNVTATLAAAFLGSFGLYGEGLLDGSQWNCCRSDRRLPSANCTFMNSYCHGASAMMCGKI